MHDSPLGLVYAVLAWRLNVYFFRKSSRGEDRWHVITSEQKYTWQHYMYLISYFLRILSLTIEVRYSVTNIPRLVGLYT